MIIDAHTHIGKAFWGDFSVEYLRKIVDKDIDFLICSNLAGIDWYTKKDENEANLEILHASTKYKKIKSNNLFYIDFSFFFIYFYHFVVVFVIFSSNPFCQCYPS